MAITRITNGITGKQAADIIYNNDIENKDEIDNINGIIITGEATVTETLVDSEYINSTGAIASAANWLRSNFIPVTLGVSYKYYGRTTSDTGTSSSGCAIVAYDSGGVFHSVIRQSYNSSIDGPFEFTLTNPSISQIRVCSRTLVRLKVTGPAEKISPIRIDKLPNLFERFQKLIPEWGDVKDPIEGAYLNAAGTAVPILTWFCTPYIKVQKEDIFEYFGKTNVGTGVARAIIGYNTDFSFNSVILNAYGDSTGFLFKVQSDSISYIRACSHNSAEFRLMKIGQVPQNQIEGLEEIANTVNLLVNNTGVGPIQSNKSYSAIGDSITAFDATGVGYQSFIRQKIEFTAYFNRGYSGRSLTNSPSGDPGRASIYQALTTSLGTNDWYSLFVGTNDFKLDASLGSFETDYLGNSGPTTFFGALRATLDLIYSKNMAAQIFLITPLRRDNDGYNSFSTNASGFKLLDYVNAIKQIGIYEAIPIIDLFNISGITDRNLGVWTNDGLHPTTEGHAVISKPIISEMKMRLTGG